MVLTLSYAKDLLQIEIRRDCDGQSGEWLAEKHNGVH